MLLGRLDSGSAYLGADFIEHSPRSPTSCTTCLSGQGRHWACAPCANALPLLTEYFIRFMPLALISCASAAPEYIANRVCSVAQINHLARVALRGESPFAPNCTSFMRATGFSSAPLVTLVRFQNHRCTLSASLAVRLYCRVPGGSDSGRREPRPMPRDLCPHLRRRGTAQGVAGIQRAAQAQHVIHVFFDLRVELLQHRQR